MIRVDLNMCAEQTSAFASLCLPHASLCMGVNTTVHCHSPPAPNIASQKKKTHTLYGWVAI